MSGTIRVLLVDDHALVRQALGSLLSQTSDIVPVAECCDGDQAIAAAIEHQPNVVVLDIDMPGIAAFQAAQVIRARVPGAKILFLSAFTHDRYIEAAIKSGAMGYLTKNEPPQRVEQAIRAVADGRTYFSPEVQARLVVDTDGVRLGPVVQSRINELTLREVEVLRYLARGMSKKEIAQVMHLSVKTVENHTANIMQALDIHDRVELARFAIREGLVEP
jgi:DNA-binding NarL/FixJ family response regulator